MAEHLRLPRTDEEWGGTPAAPIAVACGAWWFDPRTGAAGWDALAAELLGLGREPGTGDITRHMVPEDRAAFSSQCATMAEGGAADCVAFRVRDGEGRLRQLRSVAAFKDHGPRGGMVTGVLKQDPGAPTFGSSDEAVSPPFPAQFDRAIVEASTDSIMLVDLEGRILFANAHAGRSHRGPLAGRMWRDLLDSAAAAKVGRLLPKVMAGEPVRFTLSEKLPRGASRWWDVVASPVRDAQGRTNSVAVVSRDITYQKRSEERANWLAKHDPLTNLPNRLYLQNQLDDRISNASATPFALLLLDVDNFKQINDTLGHDAGDVLLRAFAERIRRAVRGDDFLARLGGDEFAVVLTGVRSEAEIAEMLDAIQAALRAPLVYSGRLLESKASIGGCLFPRDGRDRTELMKHADIALYAAKASRAGFELFRASMRDDVQKRMSMLSVAKEALQEDRIDPYYQAKIDLRTGAVAGFEALLRWHDPRLGLQKPQAIHAAFDDPQLATLISTRMIDRVIGQMRIWLDAGVAFEHVAVNASAAEFRRGDFAELLLERLELAGVPTRCFQIEVTETVFLGRGAEYVERALKTLNAAGIKIALDDFGTGYASLSHLKQFPVDVIKLDWSFVAELGRSPDASAIVQAVINLGRSLKIAVVAEGIETRAQENFLREAGCDFGQGYLYSRAVPAENVPAIIANALSP